MDFEIARWYTFCDEHKEKVSQGGDWDKMTEPDTCDWRGRKGRCGKPAVWEFYPGFKWK